MVKESEKFYHSIIVGDYDSRLKRSLESIKEVCDEREKHGGRIYVRTYVSLLEEQVRDYEEQLRILKKLFMRITPVEIDKLITEAFLDGTQLTLPPISNESSNDGHNGISLSEPARRALEKITSETHLKRFRLSLYKGRVVNEMMRKFLDKEEYQSLLNILAMEGSNLET